MPTAGDMNATAERARAWRDAAHAAVCDVFEPWEHGTIVRATAHPDYFDLNFVRVEDEPGMNAAELIAFADDVQAALRHRRVDFDLVDAGEARRADFKAAGWIPTRLLWMRHEAEPEIEAQGDVAEVDWAAIVPLREAWLREEFPDLD